MTTPAAPAAPETPPADPAADPSTAVPEGPSTEPNDPEPTPNSEAARYRVQLREAQGERDALADRLTGYQRRECEALVADLLELPTDLWEVGQADVGAFYNEDGTVNEAELRAAAGALVEQRPRLARPETPTYWGQHSQLPPGDGKVGWGDVIGR